DQCRPVSSSLVFRIAHTSADAGFGGEARLFGVVGDGDNRYDIDVTIRRITTCGRIWAWRVRPEKGPAYPGHVIVRIWPRGGGGTAARLDVRVRFDDPWLNYGSIITAPAARVAEVFQSTPVTSRLVAAAIAQALAREWDPDARGTTTTWDWQDGTLIAP